jgi:hypothetical protein
LSHPTHLNGNPDQTLSSATDEATKFASLTDEQLVGLVGTPSGNIVRDGAQAEIQRRVVAAIREFNRASSDQAQVMIRLTRWIAGLTILLAVIAAVQLWAMFRPTRPALVADSVSFTWAFAQNLDNSLHSAELCRQSLAESLYAPDLAQNFNREGQSNIFLYRGVTESYRVHAFRSQTECETALTGLKQRR